MPVARVDVVQGARGRMVALPRGGLVLGRSEDEIRRVIGAAPDTAILVLDNASVSKVHARFFWRGDDLFVEDGWWNERREHVRSRNGVHREGREILQALVLDGDELVLGDVVLRVAVEGAAYGMPRSELGEVQSTLQPSPERPASVEKRAADMLPIVETLFGAHDFTTLGQRIVAAAKEHLKPSRAAVIELEEQAQRFRILALAGAPDPSFISRTVVDESVARGVALYRSGSMPGRAPVASLIQSGATSALGATIRPRSGPVRLLYADTLLSAPHLTWTHALEAQLLAAHAAAAFDALETQRQIAEQRLRFEQLRRFFAPNVVEHLLKNPEAIGAAPQVVEASVLFADLSGYTRLSERLSNRLDTLVALLNRWLEAASRAVFAHAGTLDKFIGDAVMAVFGAPFPVANGPAQAVRAALEMREAIARISQETGEELAITVGVNTGPMLAGSVGSKKRLEFTVLGDTVNVAARLQGVAERGQILIGQATMAALGDEVEVALVGDIPVKNRRQPVKAYRVLGLRHGVSSTAG